MRLTLYELVHSPYCIPVVRLLTAYGIPFERVSVSVWDRRQLAEITGGRYYQVPLLAHDGRMVYETAEDPLTVARYLDRAFTDGELFPSHAAGLQEILVDHIENALEGVGFRLTDPWYIDGIEDVGERTMVIRHKERKMGVGCVEVWRAEGEALAKEFERLLEPYDMRLLRNPYLFGERPVYADFALYGVVENAQFGRHYAVSDRVPNVRRWLGDMAGYQRQKRDEGRIEGGV